MGKSVKGQKEEMRKWLLQKMRVIYMHRQARDTRYSNVNLCLLCFLLSCSCCWFNKFDLNILVV